MNRSAADPSLAAVKAFSNQELSVFSPIPNRNPDGIAEGSKGATSRNQYATDDRRLRGTLLGLAGVGHVLGILVAPLVVAR